MRFAVVAGARPNFMKIAPLLSALDRSGFESKLIHTGQHYDRNMSDVFFDELGIRAPDVNFEVGASGQTEQMSRIMGALELWLDANPIDGILVAGDVTSTVACALVAAKRLIPVGHVEAGLRSFDRSMPEEVNRVVVDALSTWLFTPSPDADLQLEAEGVESSRIHLVGNIMVDSLFNSLDRAVARGTAARLGVDGPYCLATLHRPALVDDPARFAPVLDALRDLASERSVVFPIHPRTRSRLVEAGIEDRLDAFIVTEPLGYLDFLSLEHGASLVLTDSGGVQEETTALGVPCLTLRENTERPITIEEGTNQLVGLDGDRIREAALETLNHPPAPRRPPLWDGKAADRITAVLARGVPDLTWRPPARGLDRTEQT
jgi:UDP-N-acetylglucosamine 2-epimerase (non-hydrolysing)